MPERPVTYNVCSFPAIPDNFVTSVGINRGIQPTNARMQHGYPACRIVGRTVNQEFLPAYGYGPAVQPVPPMKVMIVPFELAANYDKWAARIRYQPGAIIANIRVYLSFVGDPSPQPLIDLYNNLTLYNQSFPSSGDPPPTTEAREIGPNLFTEVITGDIDQVHLAPSGQIEIRQLEISSPVFGNRPTQTETTRNEMGIHFLDFWVYKDCP